MAVQLTMPRLGETVTEGTIIKWLKKEGDFVNKDENIVEVSTAKVETEIPSPASGRVSKLLVQEDETVPVGAELAVIDETATPGAREEKPAEEVAPAAPEAARPQAPPQAPRKAPVAAAAPRQAAAAAAAAAPAMAAAPAERAAPAAAGFISPIVRKLAKENNIDLSQVQGTGTGGRITRQDIERYLAAGKPAAGKLPKPPMAQAPPISLAPMPAAEVPEREFPGVPAVEAERPAEAPAPPPPPAAAPTEARPAAAAPAAPVPAAEVPGLPNERIVRIDHLRREIAAHMLQSSRETAPVTAIVDVDMSNVVKQRGQVKEAFKKREGYSLTYLPFVAKVAVDALIEFPMFNARIVDDRNMALHDYVNLGIAVAVENGLIVPVIKNAEEMNLLGLAHHIRDLAEKARSGRLSPDDVVGSTFTITNPGSFGSIIQTPIINYPNAAILSLEAIQRRPVIVDEAIAIRHMVFMPLTYDHRIVDGALAAQFLNHIKRNLETWDFSHDLTGIT